MTGPINGDIIKDTLRFHATLLEITALKHGEQYTRKRIHTGLRFSTSYTSACDTAVGQIYIRIRGRIVLHGEKGKADTLFSSFSEIRRTSNPASSSFDAVTGGDNKAKRTTRH